MARAWFHACPDGEGWVWRRTSRWRMWQARLSHRSRGLRLSRDFHKRDCHKVVTKLSQARLSRRSRGLRLSQDCHKRDCHKVVTRLSQARLSCRSRGLRGPRWSPHYTSGVEERVSNRRQSGEASQMVGQIFTTAIQKTRKKGHFLYVKKSWQCLPDTSSYCIDKKENTAAHLSRGAFLKLAAYSLQSPVEHFGSNKRFNI